MEEEYSNGATGKYMTDSGIVDGKTVVACGKAQKEKATLVNGNEIK